MMHSVLEVCRTFALLMDSSNISFIHFAEALNETAYGKGLVARGKHFLIFGSKTEQHPTLEGRERLLQNRVLVPNWLFFDDVSSTSYDDWMKKYTNIVSQNGRPNLELMKNSFSATSLWLSTRQLACRCLRTFIWWHSSRGRRVPFWFDLSTFWRRMKTPHCQLLFASTFKTFSPVTTLSCGKSAFQQTNGRKTSNDFILNKRSRQLSPKKSSGKCKRHHCCQTHRR